LAEAEQPRKPPEAACYELVQDKIAWNYSGDKRWSRPTVERLCAGTSRPREPGKCFNYAMHGELSWGGSTRWEWANAVALCEGTENAEETIGCFSAKIRGGTDWQRAIQACQSSARRFRALEDVKGAGVKVHCESTDPFTGSCTRYRCTAAGESTCLEWASSACLSNGHDYHGNQETGTCSRRKKE
jgi:hypothetical protein